MKCWFWRGPILAAIVLGALLSVDSLRSAPFDWPQWQGVDRTGMSKETGLLKTWPKDGPELVWKSKGLGAGYSTPSVSNGKIFGMSYKGTDEVVWCLNEKDGTEVWNKIIDPADKNIGQGNQVTGSRSTPTIDGDLLYVVGTAGDLVCMKVADGSQVWHKNLKKDFGGAMMSRWGYSESPLVDGDRLLCTPGGKEATLLCLNKLTGEVIWKGPVPGGDGAGYASIIIANFGGQKQYIQFLKGGVVGLSAEGKFLWRYSKPANGVSNAATPIYHDGYVFGTSAYNTGGGVAKLIAEKSDSVKAEEVWFSKKMMNHHGGVLLLDGYLYGANGGNEGGYLICLDFKTGNVMWDEKDKPNREGAKKGSVAFADDRMYYRQEDGTMLLVEPSSKEYLERGRFKQPERSTDPAWPHPVIANGKLYLRDQDVLLCYNVKGK